MIAALALLAVCTRARAQDAVPGDVPGIGADPAFGKELTEWARKEARKAQLPGHKLQSAFAHYIAVKLCAERRPSSGEASISADDVVQAKHLVTAIDKALARPNRSDLWVAAYVAVFKRPPSGRAACQLNYGALQSYFQDVTGAE
jgi:hypothetical protein